MAAMGAVPMGDWETWRILPPARGALVAAAPAAWAIKPDMQAVDTAFAGSPFAQESSFIIPGGSPSVKYLASAPSVFTADLSAQVNPLGAETFVSIQWGANASYGNVSAAQDIGDGLAFVPVSLVLSNLAPDTTYHWRLGAFNFNGTTHSADQTFTTGTTPSMSGLSAGQGEFQIQGQGRVGATCILQCSTNLTSWTNVTNLLAGTNGLIQFSGPMATNSPQQFFRLMGF